MKKLLLSIVILFSIGIVRATDNPVAHPDAIVQSGNMRFTVLTPQMIRIEYSEKQLFEDRASFTVINRRLPVPAFTKKEDGGYLYITTDVLTLKYRIGEYPVTDPAGSANLSITFNLNGKNVLWYPGKIDGFNLKGTCRTLDGSNGDNKRSELEDGLISRSGWAVIDDSYATKRGDGSRCLMFDRMDDGMDWVSAQKDKDAFDWYFMGYGRNYKQAVGDYTKVAGKIPLPPSYVFGYWYSKYQRYSSQDFMDLITDIETNDIPIDVMVIDTDWHINGWTGWSWNKDLIPDPEGLLSWLHNHHVKVPLNLHPAYGVDSNEDNFMKLCKDLGYSPSTSNIPWQLENYDFYKSMFNNIIRLRENEGVDFWWLDWQQWLTNERVDGLGETFWCNHVFYNDMKMNRTDRRPLIFHRWAGMGSHRYQIGFSGDCYANFSTLAFQPYFTATAANVGYGYWGHDLGGHVQEGDNNPELYLRWLQFGAFSPIFRTHSTNSDNIERRIWKYPNFPLMLDVVNLRYAMFPYIYTQARKSYDTGLSICRPLYYDSPEVSEAYKHDDEYMFGDDILVSPIISASGADGISSKNIWFPEGRWWNVNTNSMIEGNQSYTMQFTQSQIPYFIKEGGVIVNYPATKTVQVRPDNLIVKFIPGDNGETSLYEDSGDSNDYETAYSTTHITQTVADNVGVYTIMPREGSFDGMQDMRAYTMEMLGTTEPKTVEINGEQTAYRYDADRKTTYIDVPSVPCDAPIVVTVRYNAAGVGSDMIPDAHVYYSKSEDELIADLGELKGNVTLKIFNTTGVCVMEKKYTDVAYIREDMSSLVRNCYVCTLNTEKQNIVKKIIK